MRVRVRRQDSGLGMQEGRVEGKGPQVLSE